MSGYGTGANRIPGHAGRPQLTERNRETVERGRPYDPFGADTSTKTSSPSTVTG
jgi:hypothetical protein